MRRSDQRRDAVFACYQRDVTGRPLEELLADARPFTRELAEAVDAHGAELDATIDAHARGWELKRIAPLELNVMRVALYEIEHSEDVPDEVAIDEAVEADLDLVICITEGIPVRDMLEVRSRMRKREAAGAKKTLLLGPNCPGLITPDEIKIGIMPGHIHRKGRIGVVSRSGTLTYEAVAQLTDVGLGQSSAVGIGGDPINGLKHIDVMKLFNDDPNTDAVVMIGEIGGSDEADAARWCKANMTKPIVGFIAGVTAPPGKRMGHAGALISGGADTADAKLAVMEECGFTVTRNPSEMGRLMKALV